LHGGAREPPQAARHWAVLVRGVRQAAHAWGATHGKLGAVLTGRGEGIHNYVKARHDGRLGLLLSLAAQRRQVDAVGRQDLCKHGVEGAQAGLAARGDGRSRGCGRRAGARQRLIHWLAAVGGGGTGQSVASAHMSRPGHARSAFEFRSPQAVLIGEKSAPLSIAAVSRQVASAAGSGVVGGVVCAQQVAARAASRTAAVRERDEAMLRGWGDLKAMKSRERMARRGGVGVEVALTPIWDESNSSLVLPTALRLAGRLGRGFPLFVVPDWNAHTTSPIQPTVPCDPPGEAGGQPRPVTRRQAPPQLT
jgi:hypothetical protein